MANAELLYPAWKPLGIGRHLEFDIEGDGLLRASAKAKQVTQVWCIGAADIHTRETFYWGPELEWPKGSKPTHTSTSIEDGLRFLAEADVLIAHYGNGYDFPALEMMYPWWKRPARSWDSIIMAKLVWPADVLIGPDLARIRSGRLAPNLLKAHKLEAWGQRLGNFKAEYKGGFDAWCPEMAVYMMQDVSTLLSLCMLIYRKVGWIEPEKCPLVWKPLTFDYECEVDRIIKAQEEYGVRFDTDAAIKLSTLLKNEQAKLETKLVEVFGEWWQALDDPEQGTKPERSFKRKREDLGVVTIPRFGKNGKPLKPYVGPPTEDYDQDAPFVRIERTTFQPSSRDHLGLRLQEVYGWKPKKFGKDGKPSVDETTLEEIPESVLPADLRKTILDYFVVSKTLGMLTKGQKAWMRLVDETTSRIHGGMDTVGAVTRRATHKNPNLSQTPAVELDDDDKPVLGVDGGFGYECRSLFTADDGCEETGVDASALELIDLGHYLWPYDEGKFSARVCDPDRDPHAEHAEIAGMSRRDAKTAIYLKVYGGSAFKLSLGMPRMPDHEVPQFLNYRGLPMLLKSLERRFDSAFVDKLDDQQIAKLAKARTIIIKLEGGIDGLKKLIEDVQRDAEKGWLEALDGSRIHVRKPYAALNSLLQSAGAITCKLWMVLLHRKLAKLSVNARQILWAHDEFQFTHSYGLGKIIAECAEEAIVETGEILGLRGTYRSDAKHGRNWAECH